MKLSSSEAMFYTQDLVIKYDIEIQKRAPIAKILFSGFRHWPNSFRYPQWDSTIWFLSQRNIILVFNFLEQWGFTFSDTYPFSPHTKFFFSSSFRIESFRHFVDDHIQCNYFNKKKIMKNRDFTMKLRLLTATRLHKCPCPLTRQISSVFITVNWIPTLPFCIFNIFLN